MTQKPTTTAASDAAPSQAKAPGNGIAPLLLIAAAVLAMTLLGFGIYRAAQFGTYTALSAGGAALAATLAAAGVAAAILHTSRAGATLSDTVEALRVGVHEATVAIRRVEDNTLISERGKQVAYRDRDREAVRRAIEEDLMKGDYASARQLADEFEKAFGYKNEAERFREEIRRRLDDHRGHEIGDATSRVDDLCEAERWSDAYAEADRLIAKYDNEMRVRLLRTRIEEKRQQRKLALVNQFRSAHQRGDAEAGAALLKRLDAYLTPDEGRQLESEAREVFKERLLKLKEQYSECMHKREFSEALRLGGIIKRDYPNSQLAKEVSEHEPRLREKAGIEPAEEPAPI